MKPILFLAALSMCVVLQGCASDRSAETEPVKAPASTESVVRPDGTAAPQNFNDAIKDNPNIPDSAKKSMLGQDSGR